MLSLLTPESQTGMSPAKIQNHFTERFVGQRGKEGFQLQMLEGTPVVISKTSPNDMEVSLLYVSHSTVAVVKNNSLSIKRARRGDIDCSQHKEMINV